jgi:single-strand DNA-binding protein
MSRSLNQVTLIGNLGKDPEIRTTQDGKKIANLSLATGYKDKPPTWHRIVIFNEALVEIAEKYMKKGQQVCALGRIEGRKFEDKTGRETYITEIICSGLFMTGNRESNQVETQMAVGQDFDEIQPTRNSGLNDEIPF